MDALLPPSFLQTFHGLGIIGQSDSWKIEKKDLKIIITLTWNASQEIKAQHPKADIVQKKSSQNLKASSEGTKAAKEPTQIYNAANGYTILSWLKSQSLAGSRNETAEPAKEDLSTESGSRMACEYQTTFTNKPCVPGIESENVPDNCVNISDEEISWETNNREIKMESTESHVLWAETERNDSTSSILNPSIFDGTVAMKQERYYKSIDPEPITENSKISTYSSKGELTNEGIKSVEIEPSQTELEVIFIESEDDRQTVSTWPPDQTEKESSRTVGQRLGYLFGQNNCPPVKGLYFGDAAPQVTYNYSHQPLEFEENYGKHPYVTQVSNNNQQYRANLTTYSQSIGEQGRNKQKKIPERPPFLKSLNRVLTEKEIDKRVEMFAKKLRKQRKWIQSRYHRDYSYEEDEIGGFKRRIRAMNQWLIVKRRFDQSRSKAEGQRSLEIVPEVPLCLSDSDSDREPNVKGTFKQKKTIDSNRPPFLKSINRVLNEDELEDRIQQFSDKVRNEHRLIPALGIGQLYAANEIAGFRRRIMSLNHWHIEQTRLSDPVEESGKSSKSPPKTDSGQSSSSSDPGNASNSERRKSKKSAKRQKKELQNEKPTKCRKTV